MEVNQADLAKILASLQAQLEDTRKQLMEAVTRRDPKDLIVQEVVDAYLRELPDEIDPELLDDRKRTLAMFAEACGQKRVSEIGPVDLSTFLKNHPIWKSSWTHMAKAVHVKRAFSWAKGARLIRELPFYGTKAKKGASGRPMTDEEYIAYLRNVPAYFRRYLVALKYTGARPSEISRLRWSHINWEREIAVLREHKTAKKSGKPRVLIFHPVMIKLLRWLERNRPAQVDWRGTTRWLYNILRNGPVRKKEISRRRHARSQPCGSWSMRT